MQIVQKNAEPFFFMGGDIGCLLVHGFTGSPSEMRPLGEALGAAGCTVLGVRLAGHGTNPEEMAATSWYDWYHSVERAYIELSEQCTKVFIIGLSMGGILSLHASLEYPAAGVVSINAPVYLINQKAILAPLLRHLMPYSMKKEPTEFVEHFSYDRMPLSSLQSLLQLMRLVRKELPQVSAPLLVLQSQNDDVVNPKSAAFIYAKCGSQDKTIEYFPKSGHLITLGVEREEVARRVWNFIQSHC